MRIAQVAPLYESVPPKLYGGTERVVSYLTECLVDMGHDVTLYASGDSVTSARLRPGCERALRLDRDSHSPLADHFYLLEQVFREAHEFDIVHAHVDFLGFPFLRRMNKAHLTTLHGRLDIPNLRNLFHEYNSEPVISISNHQRLPLPDAAWLATVYHGLRNDLYRLREQPGTYLAFLGRISPEKRVDSAIEIARRAGLPLKIAAKVDKPDRDYFEHQIKPLLKGGGVEFIGEIGEREKGEFLGNAWALLFPVDWPEPFGLVMIEAMACGTPVIARARGSVPEIIQHGKTGFIFTRMDEAIRAVSNIPQLSRASCRREFEKRFSSSRMAANYLKVYEQLVCVRPRMRFKAFETAAPNGTRRAYLNVPIAPPEPVSDLDGAPRSQRRQSQELRSAAARKSAGRVARRRLGPWRI